MRAGEGVKALRITQAGFEREAPGIDRYITVDEREMRRENRRRSVLRIRTVTVEAVRVVIRLVIDVVFLTRADLDRHVSIGGRRVIERAEVHVRAAVAVEHFDLLTAEFRTRNSDRRACGERIRGAAGTRRIRVVGRVVGVGERLIENVLVEILGDARGKRRMVVDDMVPLQLANTRVMVPVIALIRIE